MNGDAGSPPPSDLIVEAFDLGAVVEPPTFAARGELGYVWRMSTDRGRWAVKQLVQPVDRSTGEDVEFQSAVLAHGVRIPRPMPTRDGAAVVVGPGGIGYRVYEWIDHDPNERVDNARAGELLARIHAVRWPASRVDAWFYQPVPDARWPQLIARARATHASWSGLLEQHVDEIMATTASVVPGPPAHVVRCHLDFNPDNVLVDHDARAWVIDWENSGGGDPAQELVQSLYDFVGHDLHAAAAFLSGYAAGGGTITRPDLGVFSMAFAVQANLVAFYARRALEGDDGDRARSVWRLETMLPRLFTLERAAQLLSLMERPSGPPVP